MDTARWSWLPVSARFEAMDDSGGGQWCCWPFTLLLLLRAAALLSLAAAASAAVVGAGVIWSRSGTGWRRCWRIGAFPLSAPGRPPLAFIAATGARHRPGELVPRYCLLVSALALQGAGPLGGRLVSGRGWLAAAAGRCLGAALAGPGDLGGPQRRQLWGLALSGRQPGPCLLDAL